MKVFIYAVPGLADWEIAYVTTGITGKRYFRDQNLAVDIVWLGDTRDPVTTMGGLTIRPDVSIREAKLAAEDLLILPGSDIWLAGPRPEIIEVAKDRIVRGLPVAAICAATVALAQAGALDAVRHTSNDKGFLKQCCPAYRGEARYVEAPAVADSNVITAEGIAPIEFAYEVFKAIGAFDPETLSAWRDLNVTKEARYFFALMESMQAKRA
ncbi:MAG TPA: DJ-1/PfpI family protein [Treponemataceae bacterium]|nr:DJ-1/PfpI family protein [Treponemataceae bacterium]